MPGKEIYVDRGSKYKEPYPTGCLLLIVMLGAFGAGIGLAHLWTLWRRR